VIVKALERTANAPDAQDDAGPAGAGGSSRRGAKAAGAFRTISEVAGELDVPQHVLRFWETRFSQIRPLKRAGGRRYYRPEDVELLRRIRGLLYQHGYTIKGVQKLLRDGGRAADGLVAAVEEEPASEGEAQPEAAAPRTASGTAQSSRAAISAAIDELVELRNLLRAHKH
jgi:DNA-binding transcriptional MerR regulator